MYININIFDFNNHKLNLEFSLMKKILVIDDDEMFRDMIGRLLERSGYEVIEAEDGKEGTKKFHQSSPDLVITDIVMPEQEGIETIEKLHSSNPSLPIIAVSGGGRINPDSYLPLAQGLGAAATFAKPFKNQELLEKVKELIG